MKKADPNLSNHTGQLDCSLACDTCSLWIELEHSNYTPRA